MAGSHFGYDDGVHGLFVVVEREPLSPGCLTAEEIDHNIEQLRLELHRVGTQMKIALRSRTLKLDSRLPGRPVGAVQR
jgi:hypothetical protein